MAVAELAVDGEVAVFLDEFAQRLVRHLAEGGDEAFLAAGAQVEHGHAGLQRHALFVEQAVEEFGHRQGRIDQFGGCQRREQHFGFAPAFVGLAARVVGGDALHQHAAGGPFAGGGAVHGDADAGGHLFRHVEIVFRTLSEGRLVERHDALVGLDVRIVLHEDQAEAAGAAEQLRHVRLSTLVDALQIGPAFGIVAGIAAHVAVGVVLTDEQRDRAVAFGLDEDLAFEFQRGADEGGQRHRFAEDLGEVVGIIMPVEDRGDAERAHADGAPADGAAFNLEGGGEIAGLVGDLGHGRGA